MTGLGRRFFQDVDTWAKQCVLSDETCSHPPLPEEPKQGKQMITQMPPAEA